MLYMLLPRAWNTLLQTMLTAASGKVKEVMRKAGMPMAIMASEASNRRSSGTGRKKNAAQPSSMMVTAVMVEVRMA